MQIEDSRVITWLWEIVSAVLAGIVLLLGLIYKSDKKQIDADRERIQTLEEKMASAVTLSQVNEIVDRVEMNFRDEHKSIEARMQRAEDRLSVAITNSHDSLQASIEPLQESIQAIHNALTQPYRGADRRRQ